MYVFCVKHGYFIENIKCTVYLLLLQERPDYHLDHYNAPEW